MSISIEKNVTRAAQVLGIELKYPATLTDALKRRTATEELRNMTRRDPGAELGACANHRRFPSLLEEIAQHNAVADAALQAVQGGVHGAALARVEHEYAAFQASYLDQAHKTVTAAVNEFTTAAQHCPTLDPAKAVQDGYGDRLTAIHEHGARLLAHLDVIAVKTTSYAQRAGDQLAAIVATSDPIKALRMSATHHRAQVSQTLSSTAEVANRDAARRLISDAQQDMLSTLHAIARGNHPGYSLHAAKGDEYADRLGEWRNADIIQRVEVA